MYETIIAEFMNDSHDPQNCRTLYKGTNGAEAFKQAADCSDRLCDNGYDVTPEVGKDKPDPTDYPYNTTFTCDKIPGLLVCVYVRKS